MTLTNEQRRSLASHLMVSNIPGFFYRGLLDHPAVARLAELDSDALLTLATDTEDAADPDIEDIAVAYAAVVAALRGGGRLPERAWKRLRWLPAIVRLHESRPGRATTVLYAEAPSPKPQAVNVVSSSSTATSRTTLTVRE